MPVARHQVAPLLERVNAVIARAAEAGVPVICIGNEFEGYQWIANVFRRFAAMKGRPGAELDERLHRGEHPYYAKKRGDALTNPLLLQHLRELGIRRLIIAGLYAEGCVAATARGAVRRGFQAAVLRDAVAGGSDRSVQRALRGLEQAGIGIRDSGEPLEEPDRTGP